MSRRSHDHRHDAIVLGSDPEALVAAAYLARAGRSVLILEARDQLGGPAITEEFAPGCCSSATFAGAETFSMEILSDLKLAKHGLRFTAPGPLFVPDADGPALLIEPPRRRRRKLPTKNSPIDEHDQRAFGELDAQLRRLSDAFAGLFTQPLPDLDGAGIGHTLDLLRRGWRLRRLGAHHLAEAMRTLPMPIADVLDERLQSAALKALIAADAIRGSWLGPRSPGSTLNLLLHRFGRSRGALRHPEQVVGGTGGLVKALAGAARAAGAEARCEAPVSRLLVEDRKVCGVVLESGEELAAGTVFSSLDPRTTFLDLVDPFELEPEFVQAIRQIRGRGTVAIVKYVLDRLPRFHGAPEDPRYLGGRIQLGSDLDTLERAFDDVKYGRVPARPLVEITLPSIADPKLAPKDKVVLNAWVQHVPYHLRDGDWDGQKAELTRNVERRISEFVPSFPTHVEHVDTLTPLDLERRFGLRDGCLYHVEPALDQMLYMRPVPGWSQYRTPIEGLYLCGPGTHGGGPLSGLPGRNAVRQAVKDGD